MKDIGSIYPLYNEDLKAYDLECDLSIQKDCTLVSLCREALFLVARDLNPMGGGILIPSYTCDTVYNPFIQEGFNCIFYPIHKNLRIDTCEIENLAQKFKPQLIVVHPFYGMDLNVEEISVLNKLSKHGTKICYDMTQIIFSNKRYDFVDYYVGSLRKWFPIPDGAFFYSKYGLTYNLTLECENRLFVESQISAMYLRGRYYNTDDIDLKRVSYRVSKAIDSFLSESIRAHDISKFTKNALLCLDKYDIQKKRRDNYIYLYNSIVALNSIDIKPVCSNIEEVTTAPLYFPIYVKNRNSLQRYMTEFNIYLPILWPVDEESVLINDTVGYIYNNLICIPCDQRYNHYDMQKVIDKIKEWIKEKE